MIKLNNNTTREHCGKYLKQIYSELYPYNDWLHVEERERLHGKRGKRVGHFNQPKSGPFSPENFPLPIKYLVLDREHSCVTERTIYSPQQFVVPTILYYLYLYFVLLVMVTSSHLTTGGKPLGPWLLVSTVSQVGCGLSFLCMSQIIVAFFYLVSLCRY